MNKIRLPDALKIAAVVIAAPRYTGAFAAAIGISALTSEDYQWIEGVEVYSGFAMAVLEGFALSYVWGKWRVLNNLDKKSFNWFVLLFFVTCLALTIPFISLTYLLMMQDSLTTSELFGDNYFLQVAWTFLVAGVPMLIIMAVGFADVDMKVEKVTPKVKKVELAQPLIISPDAEVTFIPIDEEVKSLTCPNSGCTFVGKSKIGLGVHKNKCKWGLK